MSWRMQPPAFSPVEPATLGAGLLAAAGLSRPNPTAIEDELKLRYRATSALLTDSGTAALVLALRLLVPPGGTIAYPSYGCIDLTAAALRAGVRVRLYDLDPETLTPDLQSVSSVIARGVDAILVAHLFGYAADIPAVKELASTHGIPIIEDAAQAGAGSLRGDRLGALADVSILSFGRGKGTTAGSGGALLTRGSAHHSDLRLEQSLGAQTRGFRGVAALAAQWALARSFLYRLPASIPALKLGEMTFRPAGEPRRMSAAAQAMLTFSLRTEPPEFAHRRRRADELLRILRSAGRGLVPIRPIDGAEPGFLRLPFIDTSGMSPVSKSLGIARGYPLTLDQHEELSTILLAGERSGSGGRLLRDRLLTAPTHSRVTADDIDRFRVWAAGPDLARAMEVMPT